ncbi:MAG TPA: hypothetical protein VNV16_00635, partial [Methylibium sp.]|nr:hypothetical protein [Methylibium sp.]
MNDLKLDPAAPGAVPHAPLPRALWVGAGSFGASGGLPRQASALAMPAIVSATAPAPIHRARGSGACGTAPGAAGSSFRSFIV